MSRPKLEISVTSDIGSITQYGNQVIEVNNIEDKFRYNTDLVKQTASFHFLTSELIKKRTLTNNIDRLKKIFNTFTYYFSRRNSYPKNNNREQYVLFCKKFNYRDMLVNLEFELKYFFVRDRRKVEIENVEYREVT